MTAGTPGAERLFGYTADEVVGKSVTNLFPLDLQNEEFAILERIRLGEQIEHYETVRCRKDGTLVDISLTVSPLRNVAGKVTGVSKIARNISTRKQAEHERLLALQDEERRRIANELHDSTVQHLVAISLNLMRLRADAAAKAETLNIVDEIDGSLEEAIRELSAFTYLLHPPDLQTEGLSATLGRYVEGFGRRTGLKITLRSCRSVDQLSLPLQQTLLRIVQEALTNVYRHASATRVSVNFRCVGKRLLRLVISDDGQGTEETSGRQNGEQFRLGVGIPGMIARMRQFGGNLDIHSGPNGTAVHATVFIG